MLKERSKNQHPRVLLIYTGGTIGMRHTDDGYAPVPGWMAHQLSTLNTFQEPGGPPRTMPPTRRGKRIQYDIIEYDPLLDSTDMGLAQWVKTAKDIEANYNEYDGFVVLHGTDTMAYTAAALSFMLVNLSKPVILTGSQIPLSELRNDGVDNLLGAITIAGIYQIPEVCLYFNNQLFRGNRVQKVDASGLGAFQSGNLAPLATVGVDIKVNWHLVQDPSPRALKLRAIKEQNVVCLRLFPGLPLSIFEHFLRPPIRGVVLESFGSGNFPATRKDLLTALQKAIARGVVVVNCTQCSKGAVTVDYAAGSLLQRIGVCSGHDMTPEAALTKLAFLLSQDDLDTKAVKRFMAVDIRGELTDPVEPEGYSFAEQRFADSVAKVLAQGERVGATRALANTLYPVLMCSAAMRGDIEAMERMLTDQASVNLGHHDGRTPLHLAASEGQLAVVEFLLEQGAETNVVDRWGGTPLTDAERAGYPQIAALLIDWGARMDYGELVHKCCDAASNGDLETVKTVLSEGVPVNLVDYDRSTPLHRAAEMGHLDVVSFLLENGATQELENRWSQTPLDLSMTNGHDHITDLLFDALDD